MNDETRTVKKAGRPPGSKNKTKSKSKRIKKKKKAPAKKISKDEERTITVKRSAVIHRSGKEEKKPHQPNLKFQPAFIQIAKDYMMSGCTQYEVAKKLGVTEQTLYYWCREHPEFKQALRVGFEEADNRVEISLYEKAVGYKWQEEIKTKKIDENGNPIEETTLIDKQLPPDNSAIFFWLKNRRGHRWKDKHEVTVNHNLNVLTTTDLNNLISASILDGNFQEIQSIEELKTISGEVLDDNNQLIKSETPIKPEG